MEIQSYKGYPLSLGLERKNYLKEARGSVAGGRWVNVNHDDWENSEWVKVPCSGILYDRAIGHRKYTQYNSDLAIFTYYIDPVLEMPIYDLLPIYSPLFDTHKSPEGNYKNLNDWANVEANFDYIAQPIPIDIPIAQFSQILVMGLVGFLLGDFYKNMPNFK